MVSKLDLTLINIFGTFRRGWQEYSSPLNNIYDKYLSIKKQISLYKSEDFFIRQFVLKLTINQHKEEVTWLTH